MSSIASSGEGRQVRSESPEKLSSPKAVSNDGVQSDSLLPPNVARSFDSTQDNAGSILSMSLTADNTSPKADSSPKGQPQSLDDQLPNLLAAALVTALQDAALGNPALLLQHLLGFGPDDYNDLLAALSEPGSSYVGIIAAYLHNLRVVAEDHVAGNSGSTCISESINQILIAKYTHLLTLVERMKQANTQSRSYAAQTAAHSGFYGSYPASAAGYYPQAYAGAQHYPAAAQYMGTDYAYAALQQQQQQLLASQVAATPYGQQLSAYQQQQQQQQQQLQLALLQAQMQGQGALGTTAAAQHGSLSAWPQAGVSSAPSVATSMGGVGVYGAATPAGKVAVGGQLNLEQMLLALQYGGYQ